MFLRIFSIIVISTVIFSRTDQQETIKAYDNYPSIFKILKFSEINIQVTEDFHKTVLFVDVDDVLITPKDLVLRSCDGKNPFTIIGDLRKDIYANQSEKKSKALILLGKLRLSRKIELTEKSIPEILKNLRNKGVQVVAITHANTGSGGPIKNVEEWEINELKN